MAESALVTQNLLVADVALATLAANTPIVLNALFSSTLRTTFLVKRLRYFLMVSNMTGGEGPLAVGIGPGDASQGEAAAALTVGNTVGVSDLTQMRDQDNQNNIFQNSVELMEAFLGANGDQFRSSGHWISLGKGLPIVEDGGVDLWCYNLDAAALTTGAIIKGIAQLQGVWLGS